MRYLLVAFLTVFIQFSYGATCDFDNAELSFSGSPAEQASCLLRDVGKWGSISDENKRLPSFLSEHVGKSVEIDVEALLSYMDKYQITESVLGGSLSSDISRSGNGNSTYPQAKYFVIHDTSTPNYLDKEFPDLIHSPGWKYNDLSMWEKGNQSVAHIFISRTGASLSPIHLHRPWRATKFELRFGNLRPKGLFIHSELVQPRKSDSAGSAGNDAVSPQPGFTAEQYQRLALVYVAASVRKGTWLVPAYHAVLDSGYVGGHDDPQAFDLTVWSEALSSLASELSSKEPDQATPNVAPERDALSSAFLGYRQAARNSSAPEHRC